MASTSEQPEALSVAWRSTLAVLAAVSCVGIFVVLLVLSGTLRTGLVVALVVLEVILAAARAIKLRYKLPARLMFADARSFVFAVAFTTGAFGGVQFVLDGTDGPSAVLAGITFAVLFTAVMWLIHRTRTTLS